MLEGRLANPAFLPEEHPTQLLLMRYLTRSMHDGSSQAAALFDDMVDVAQRWVERHHEEITADPRAYAAVLVAMLTGRLMMHEQLSRVLGVDVLSAAGHVRAGRAAVDIHVHALLTRSWPRRPALPTADWENSYDRKCCLAAARRAPGCEGRTGRVRPPPAGSPA